MPLHLGGEAPGHLSSPSHPNSSNSSRDPNKPGKRKHHKREVLTLHVQSSVPSASHNPDNPDNPVQPNNRQPSRPGVTHSDWLPITSQPQSHTHTPHTQSHTHTRSQELGSVARKKSGVVNTVARDDDRGSRGSRGSRDRPERKKKRYDLLAIEDRHWRDGGMYTHIYIYI